MALAGCRHLIHFQSQFRNANCMPERRLQRRIAHCHRIKGTRTRRKLQESFFSCFVSLPVSPFLYMSSSTSTQPPNPNIFAPDGTVTIRCNQLIKYQDNFDKSRLRFTAVQSARASSSALRYYPNPIPHCFQNSNILAAVDTMQGARQGVFRMP